MAVTSDQRIEIARTDSLIKHFNRRWKTARKQAWVKYRQPSLNDDYSLGNKGLVASFDVSPHYSPNRVSIHFGLNFNCDTRFQNTPSNMVVIPSLSRIRQTRSPYVCSTIQDGVIRVERQSKLLFQAGFEVQGPNSTGEHEVTYLRPEVLLGKEDETFLDIFSGAFLELATRKNYPAKRAIDFAFSMYQFHPKSWCDRNPIPYPLEID